LVDALSNPWEAKKMARKLFNTETFESVLANQIDNAISAVGMLDRTAFTLPTLAGRLEEIVAQHAINVPQIGRPTGGKAGAPGFLDVTIPFRGDWTVFGVIPTRATIPPWMCEVMGDRLVASIRDDDANTQQRVDTFVREISDNLNALRGEATEGRSKINDAVREAGEKRRLKIVEEDNRGKGLDFPVTR